LSSLDSRGGWPKELLVLLERHPRSTWPAQRSASVTFWLEIHDHFRRDCVGLELAADDYRDHRRSASQLAVIAEPRLRGLIAGLHGHHQIEDFHYFPAFRRAEPRLARGFDLLESDHADLQRDVDAALGALKELRAAAESSTEGTAMAPHALAADRYIDAANRLCRRLCRHLSDEEDLVVPILLEGGDH
jgi:hypothetical protein